MWQWAVVEGLAMRSLAWGGRVIAVFILIGLAAFLVLILSARTAD